jgi:hypothetical protein
MSDRGPENIAGSNPSFFYEEIGVRLIARRMDLDYVYNP